MDHQVFWSYKGKKIFEKMFLEIILKSCRILTTNIILKQFCSLWDFCVVLPFNELNDSPKSTSIGRNTAPRSVKLQSTASNLRYFWLFPFQAAKAMDFIQLCCFCFHKNVKLKLLNDIFYHDSPLATIAKEVIPEMVSALSFFDFCGHQATSTLSELPRPGQFPAGVRHLHEAGQRDVHVP